jgi:endonuclease G
MPYLILLLIFSFPSLAQNYLVPKNQAYHTRSGYSFSYNQGNKVCNWLSYTLTSNDVKGSKSPKNKIFHKDSIIKVCPTEDMYDGYSFVKGQFKPRSASRNSFKEMREVYNMINVVPMNINLSKGYWRIMDNMISGWAVIFDSVFVIKGPIYEKIELEKVGSGKIKVPSKFFIVVLVKNGLDLGTIGFILSNNNKPNNLQNCSKSVDSVELITGYDFFSELPDYLEVFIEESYEPEIWKDKSNSFQLKSKYVELAKCVAVEKSGKRCEMKTLCVTQNCWKHGCDLKSK